MGVEHIEEIGTTVDKWGLEKFQLCSRLLVCYVFWLTDQ